MPYRSANSRSGRTACAGCLTYSVAEVAKAQSETFLTHFIKSLILMTQLPTSVPSSVPNFGHLQRMVLSMPMTQTLRLQFIHIESGAVVLEIPVQESFTFRPGQLQATPVFAIADFAAVAAAGTLPGRQLVTEQHGDSKSLPGSYVPAIPGAPPIPLVNSALWRWIGQARPYCGRGAGFCVG